MTGLSRWQLGQDLALAGLAAALGLLEIWLPLESIMGDGSPVVSTAGVLLVAGLLSQRRRRPSVTLASLAVWPLLGVAQGGDLQILFFGQLLPLVLVVYSVARHGAGRLKWGVAAAAAGLLLLGDLTVDLLQGPGELVFHWGVVTIAYLTGRGLRAAEDRATAAAARAVEAETESRVRASAAVAEERARIARELHDIVAHAVSVIVVQAGAAEQVVEEDPAFTRQALTAIRTTGTSALGEMRRVVTMLRAPDAMDLTPQPGVASLPALVDAARAGGLAVELTIDGHAHQLPAGLDLTTYRIVQEALTNVRRHSVARRAAVRLAFGPGTVDVSVTDDGPARSASTGSGHGLVGMRERVSLFGGRLETGRHGAGYRVRAELPLEAG